MKQKLQTWNKLEILGAVVTLQDILEADDYPISVAMAEQIQCFAEDIIDILEGRISPLPNEPYREQPVIFNADFAPPPNAVPRDFVVCPGEGFVPVLGELNVDEQSLTWYTDEEAPNDKPHQ